jgi:hypothetical protein
MTRLFLAFFLVLFQFTLRAQEYPRDYFRSPLDIPLLLSGNFGELRSNHFHAGLDIKTQGTEGLKVYAIADGYVSRIKVSPYGYGHALYITHPNGYTSVYGHLKKYSDKIAKLVKEEQYRKESFSVQLFLPPYQLRVKKGEIVAYSGNTGGSGGPHLHFEIRDTRSEHPINPLFFGFDIQDQLQPDIYAITLYPLNDSSLINGKNSAKRVKAYGKNGVYHLSTSPELKAYGLFGLGIETVDRMNGTGNSYGLHNIQLLHNQQAIFEQQIDEFAFHEGRYINAHIDYETYIRYRRRVQKSFVQKGNKLRLYKTLENKGVFELNDDSLHSFSYRVSDLNGNTSSLNFNIKAEETGRIESLSEKKAKIISFFPYDQRNTFVKDRILVDLPKGVLYDDLYFEYEEKPALTTTVSPVFQLHNHYTPLHSYITVSIKMPHLSPALRDKAVIVSTTDGKSLYAEGGEWNNDNIRVKTRSFGAYAVAIDSIAPLITPVNIYPGAAMQKKWSISVKIDDQLSGIESYRASIDGKWILMEYDAKQDLLSYFFDERVPPGKHLFRLEVKDKVGNSSTYEASFNR